MKENKVCIAKMYSDFSEMFENRRKELKITYQELANMSKTNICTAYNVLNGITVATFETFLKIAYALGYEIQIKDVKKQ